MNEKELNTTGEFYFAVFGEKSTAIYRGRGEVGLPQETEGEEGDDREDAGQEGT